MKKLICRWLAVMLALPAFLLAMFMPEGWPIWVLGWFAIACVGFG